MNTSTQTPNKDVRKQVRPYRADCKFFLWVSIALLVFVAWLIVGREDLERFEIVGGAAILLWVSLALPYFLTWAILLEVDRIVVGHVFGGRRIFFSREIMFSEVGRMRLTSNRDVVLIPKGKESVTNALSKGLINIPYSLKDQKNVLLEVLARS